MRRRPGWNDMQGETAKFAEFNQVVATLDELTAIGGPPMPQSIAKETDRIDNICREFIMRSPFCLIASSDPGGFIDVSPKGDPAGFVQVLNERLLAVPDRPGNRRFDTSHNVLKDPRVGMIFIIPDKRETLRLNGEARIVRDEAVRRSMAVNGKVPGLAMIVYVERVFSHCPKCMIRSKLWEPAARSDHKNTASHFETMVEHGKLEMSPQQLQAEAARSKMTGLY